jgi:hypothetical protein
MLHRIVEFIINKMQSWNVVIALEAKRKAHGHGTRLTSKSVVAVDSQRKTLRMHCNARSTLRIVLVKACVDFTTGPSVQRRTQYCVDDEYVPRGVMSALQSAAQARRRSAAPTCRSL